MFFIIKWTDPETGKPHYSKKMSESEAIKWRARMNSQWPERNHVVTKHLAPGTER
jgi:hypothetical protein